MVNQVYLRRGKQGALLFLGLLVFGYTTTKTAGMPPIEKSLRSELQRLRPWSNDHHADPGGGLQNRTMTAHLLNQSQRTEKTSKSGFHSVDDCDRRLPSV